jgi:hypothetical protein
LLEWARAAIDAASRWCPDASGADRNRASDRLMADFAGGRGLRSAIALPAFEGNPTCGERDLLESAEELLRTGQIPSPNPILESLATDAPHLDPIHPLGFAMGRDDRTCGDCAWNAHHRCLQTFRPGLAGRRIDENWQACARWEPRLTDDSCGTCGACCREGYSLAPVKRGEAMAKAHPEWVVESSQGRCLPRPGGRCVALDGEGTPTAPWRCRDYAVRMRACSELAAGSKACLVARRRVGLSR